MCPATRHTGALAVLWQGPPALRAVYGQVKRERMGEYVDVGGVHTWYDSVGAGQPLLLLHGGLVSNTMWGEVTVALGRHFHVLAPERRAHGHTPDVPGPITYDAMAEDTIGFMESIECGPADLVGWSDGAVVALLVALRRPDLVRQLVVYGGLVDVSANLPAMGYLVAEPPDSPALEEFRTRYAAQSPDGAEHWPTVWGKVAHLWKTEPHIALTELHRVRAHTLVMAGDDDLVRLEHVVAMYEAIPDCELAVLPGASHAAHLDKPELFDRILLDFLLKEPVPTMLPIRRAQAGAPTPA